MELINIEKSKVVALASYRMTKGQPFYPTLLGAIAARYQFQILPENHPAQTNPNGASLSLKIGSWRDIEIEVFDIYGDGFVVAGQCDTSTLDLFVDDVQDFISSKFGIVPAAHPSQVRLYDSQVVVSLDPKFEKKFDFLKQLYGDLNAMVSSYTGEDPIYRFGGMHIETDELLSGPRKPGRFLLARRVGVDFNAGYWFASAGLKTQDHLTILTRLETNLLS